MSAALPDQEWGWVQTGRFGLAFPLPDREGWRIDDHRTRWLVAEHGPSRSVLRLRSWRASRLARREECALQLRLWRPDLFEVDPALLVDQRLVEVPAGFQSELSVGVQRLPDGTSYEGFALLIGAGPSRCVAVLFTTQVPGNGAEQALGERLALFVEGTLPRVQAVQIDDLVGAERP